MILSSISPDCLFGSFILTHSLATYIANRYFDAERAGYAAAIGVFSFVMIMIISMIVNAYFRKKEVDL